MGGLKGPINKPRKVFMAILVAMFCFCFAVDGLVIAASVNNFGSLNGAFIAQCRSSDENFK